ncbi:uncharacterized protein [Rutidosis leptorrhynchoides]|uniref:uncharacterized protein n=1 Tax=Rutidosis leptorrhynchoides TaxID=125765 RepID=UPI003A99CBC0
MHNRFIMGNPWVMMGDFNAALFLEDSSAGSSKVTIAMREFQECVEKLHMEDVNHAGFRYTWNQRPNAEAYRISDHCPAILKFAQMDDNKPRPFKLSNYITDHEKFRDCVSEGWKVEIKGHKMFKVVKRMRLLKKQMRKLMWSKGHLHNNVDLIRRELDDIQSLLDKNPECQDTRKQESVTLKKYNEAIYEEECFLKQKSKVEWLRAGDSNTKYFHNVVKGRNHRSKIHAIENQDGMLVEGRDVCNVVLEHYKKKFGKQDTCSPILDTSSLFVNHVSNQKATEMVSVVSTEEIKSAMFDINDVKSLGPDGYSAAFFKKAWEIIGEDVVKAIKDFFQEWEDIERD